MQNYAKTIDINEKLKKLIDNIETVFKGKRAVVEYTLAVLLSEGHVLIEDLPGTGKTTLGLSIARSFDFKFKRIQFTSDLMPSDITGLNVWDREKNSFKFLQGPVFTNILLADEINRATPRTQSSMLEAMNERQVTIDNKTYKLAEPFFVIATQNPFEIGGTYKLPESQLDRFTLCLDIGFPEPEIERKIIKRFSSSVKPVEMLEPVANFEDLKNMKQQVEKVTMSPEVFAYLESIIAISRAVESPFYGLSTRAAIQLHKLVRSFAFIKGRNFVIPDDFKKLFVYLAAHRLIGKRKRFSREEAKQVIEEMLAQVKPPL